MNIVKLYVKCFLYSSITFGILVSLLFYFLDPFTETFSEALAWGMMGGVLFAIFMTWRYAPRQIGENGEIYKTNPKREIILELDLAKSYGKTKNILEKLGFEIKTITDDFSHLRASTGFHFLEWQPSSGENINITFQQVDKEKTLILVSSRPKIPTQLFDAGKNFLNVERIIDELKLES